MGNQRRENPQFMDPSSNDLPNRDVGDRTRNYQRGQTASTSEKQTTTATATQMHSMYEGGEEPQQRGGGGVFSKIIIVLLALGVGGLGYYSHTLNENKKKTEIELNEQKQQIIKELDGLKTSYDRAVDQNKITNKELIEARDKITLYIDSLRTMKISVGQLARYKNQVFTLKKERERLLAINDSLRKQNQLIRRQKDSISAALRNATSYADSLANLTTKLKEVVETGEDLQISKLVVDAVKARSSGKLINTSRAKAADKIRVCFTVVANKIAPSGAKNFYIEVTAPNGRRLGKNASVSVGGTKMLYSSSPRFIYANENIDICDYINKVGKSFEKGTYQIKIFDNKLNSVGNAELLLK